MLSPDYGMQVFLFWRQETADRDLQLVKAAGFRWVKQEFAWREIEGAGRGIFDWTNTDRVMNQIDEYGLHFQVCNSPSKKGEISGIFVNPYPLSLGRTCFQKPIMFYCPVRQSFSNSSISEMSAVGSRQLRSLQTYALAFPSGLPYAFAKSEILSMSGAFCSEGLKSTTAFGMN